jgi:aerobic carbon-monoxide dehydrogenase small subunit
MSEHNITLNVNGAPHDVSVAARQTLLDCLRDELGLKGAHAGCEQGVCGACTVLLDGVPVRSCLLFAVMTESHHIRTIEGEAGADGALSIVQDAFWERHGLQCGYCTPAMILTATALLERTEQPTDAQIRDALSGNLCRCTGYQQIVEAVQLAAERYREDTHA